MSGPPAWLTALRAIVSLIIGAILVLDAVFDADVGQGAQIVIGLLLMGVVSAEAITGWVRRS